jgi:hypothetical protein
MGTLDTVVSKDVMLSNRLGNIRIWKSTMKSILMKEDLWDLVEEIAIPSESTSGGKSKIEDIPQPLSPAAHDKLRRRCLRAKSIIELSVDLDLRVHIEDDNDPRTAWRNLLALFQTNTIVDTMLVLNKWEQLRMEDQMDVATFFTKVYEIKKELQLAGHAQTTGVLVHRVLSRLPSRFRPLVQQIRSERVMPTLEELHARLQMEENFQAGEHRQDRSDPEEALIMHICNVVRRHFPPNPHALSNYSRPQTTAIKSADQQVFQVKNLCVIVAASQDTQLVTAWLRHRLIRSQPTSGITTHSGSFTKLQLYSIAGRT